MARKAFDKIMAGLEDAKAIAAGTADPADHRVHSPGRVDAGIIRKQDKLGQRGPDDGRSHHRRNPAPDCDENH
ncbi:hypothetical protein [Inquilinus sp. CA228]|uniref:hypothetical protein n=1 Tax=Inquilinus sp. CA228 TaxID=3455609 RepID=UPI003F8D15FA